MEATLPSDITRLLQRRGPRTRSNRITRVRPVANHLPRAPPRFLRSSPMETSCRSVGVPIADGAGPTKIGAAELDADGIR